jgi:hypothetical protein
MDERNLSGATTGSTGSGSTRSLPLLEDLFYGERDLEEHYGLASLRKAVAAAPGEP